MKSANKTTAATAAKKNEYPSAFSNDLLAPPQLEVSTLLTLNLSFWFITKTTTAAASKAQAIKTITGNGGVRQALQQHIMQATIDHANAAPQATTDNTSNARTAFSQSFFSYN